MVFGNGSAIVHGPPLLPRIGFVLGRIPYSLAPDDVEEIQGFCIVHDPLGDFVARDGCVLSAHVVSYT